MPFTISHAVLAVPLARLSRDRLPVAALAIGCMTPDLIRLIARDDCNISHQWSSILFPDVFIGIAFSLLWYILYRPYLYKIFAIQDKIQLTSMYKKLRFLGMSVVAIILGIVTHLLWDGLTHADARTLLFYKQLAQPIHIFGIDTSIHMVAQLLSSIIPLPIILVMILRYYRRYGTDSILVNRDAILLNGAIVLLVGCVFLIETFNIDTLASDPYHTIGDSIIYFFKGFMLALTTLSLFNQVQKRIM